MMLRVVVLMVVGGGARDTLIVTGLARLAERFPTVRIFEVQTPTAPTRTY